MHVKCIHVYCMYLHILKNFFSFFSLSSPPPYPHFKGGSCIYTHGEDSYPLVHNCTIANANNVGIFVDDHAKV